MVLTAEQHHPNIKIFVSAHKQATFPEGEQYCSGAGGRGECCDSFHEHFA